MQARSRSFRFGQHIIQLVDGRHAGRNFAFFNAIEGFSTDAGTFGQFRLRQLGRPAACNQLSRQARTQAFQCRVITVRQLGRHGR